MSNKPGRVLDQKVAEVLDVEPKHEWGSSRSDYYHDGVGWDDSMTTQECLYCAQERIDLNDKHLSPCVPKPYSTSWAAAGEVLEWLTTNADSVELEYSRWRQGWAVNIYANEDENVGYMSKSAPEALCLALLKAREEGLL